MLLRHNQDHADAAVEGRSQLVAWDVAPVYDLPIDANIAPDSEIHLE